jgi:hypothetical protein
MALGRQFSWLLRWNRPSYLSAVTCGSMGRYVARSQRDFSSNEKLVDVTVNEKTGKKLLEFATIFCWVQ